MRLTWPLIGRTDELQVIHAALASPDVSGVIVCGAEGVGKSRMVKEALTAAASRGYVTHWTAGASSAQAIPLGAFAAWAPPGVTETVQLLRGVIDALTAAPTSAAGVVVAVDDAHLLDELSTFVIQQLVHRGAAKVMVTIRADATVPASIRELWKAGHFVRIDVGQLSSDDACTLLSATLGANVDRDACRRLWQLTGGNVLYLRNIVEQELADGRIVNQHGCWRWIGEPVIPTSLVELIEARIGVLPAAVGEVIDVLAVGEPIELAALVRIVDARAVEEAETRGLVTLEPAGLGVDARVAHPLYGQVRRTRAPRSRLRRLRGLIATELAASPDRDDVRVVVRRAALSLDSDLAPDADLLVAAAHGAVWLGDLPLADRLAAAAIRAGAGPEPNLVRAHALSWLGCGAAAEAVLADVRVGELAAADQARFAFLRASNLLWALGDPQRAKRVIDEASRTSHADAGTYVDAFLTVYWFALDQPQAALAAAKDLDPDELPVVTTELAWALTQLAADAGRAGDAASAAAQGYAAATRALDAPHMRFNIADAHVTALLFSGDVAAAREVAERTLGQAAELPGAAQLLGAAVAGRAALGAGDVANACRLLEDATHGLAVSHAGGWGHRYRVALATALAIGGFGDAAAAELAAVDEVRREFRLLDFERSMARAWVTANQGAVSEGIKVMTAAAERARAAGRLAEEVMCLQTATQFGDPGGAVRLGELVPLVEGPRAALAARFAAALQSGDGDELAASSVEFERMGDRVAAIDAAAHAALAFRRHDRRGSALNCSTRADALATQCGAVTPALRLASMPLPLTAREVELVMLIGAGLSNREIAERLTLSVRTVESHVYRAMAKTGTTSRDELGALLARPAQTT